MADLPPLPDEIKNAALKNKAFRRVVYTFNGTSPGTPMQITVYRVLNRIPAEIHPNTQTIAVMKGRCGLLLWDNPSNPEPRTAHVPAGQPIFIPAGTKHEVRNISEKGSLRIVSFYNPPHDPPGTVDETYEAGEERERRENRSYKACSHHLCKELAVSMCDHCKRAFYCSVKCQATHWALHKRVCGTLECGEALRFQQLFIGPQKREHETDEHSTKTVKHGYARNAETFEELLVHMDNGNRDVEVRTSTIPGAGYGLFAKRRFLQDEPITRYYGLIIKHSAARNAPIEAQSHMRALFLLAYTIDGKRLPATGFPEGVPLTDPSVQLDGLGMAAMANDAEAPPSRELGFRNNAVFDKIDNAHNRRVIENMLDTRSIDPNGRIVFLRATEDIEPGQEIFVGYGNRYWRSDQEEEEDDEATSSDDQESYASSESVSASLGSSSDEDDYDEDTSESGTDSE